MKLKLLGIAFIALNLQACGGDDDPASSSPISIMGVDGMMTSIEGVWKRPCVTDSTDVVWSHTFSGSVLTIEETTYTTTDASCGGTATVANTYVATVSVGDTIAITGWVDGMGSATTAPTAIDASGALSDTESVTALTTTFTSSTNTGAIAVGDAFSAFYVLDNTGTPNLMYGEDDFDAGTASAVDALVKQ